MAENTQPEDLRKEWYVVNCYAGQENQVKKNLERRVETMGLQNSLFQIFVPEETEVEYKNGTKKEKKHNLFSGYILVQMKMTDEAWYIVRNTPGVTGFIGSSGKGAKPFPVSDEEVNAVMRRVGQLPQEVTVDYGPGDAVDILSGAYAGQHGYVTAMDDSKEKAMVEIIMFQQKHVIEVDYAGLKKSED